MVVASSSPQRRSTDTSPAARARVWWSQNGVVVAMFVLLGVIMAGEVSDFLNDRAQERRDRHQECVLGNAVEQGAESLVRLREQAPTMQAARAIIAAQTPEERLAAADELRRIGVPTFDAADLAKPEDCGAP